jgi:hypothetical protein
MGITNEKAGSCVLPRLKPVSTGSFYWYAAN